MPKSLPVIDISAPVCCAPVAAGPMSDGDALAVALRLIQGLRSSSCYVPTWIG